MDTVRIAREPFLAGLPMARALVLRPGIKKALIGKVLGEQGGGSSEMIISAIQWAVENGANIISMSLGIDFPGFVRQLEENGLPTEIAASRALKVFVLTFCSLSDLLH
jgi:hypothetical protein